MRDPAPPPGRPDAPSDPRWARLLLCAGALLGLLTVAMAALAAHLPETGLAPGGRALLRTAVQMQGWHVPALLCCGLLLRNGVGRAAIAIRAAGCCFGLGIAGFCAGLYGLAFAGATRLAHVAPLGGSLLMLGWLLLFVGCALSGRA